jgi:ABC-type transporter Mla MlaB component
VAVAASYQTDLPGLPAGFTVSQLAARTGLRLSGQADVCTAGVLAEAIAALPCDADEIHLQLASLDFIDVAATRELVMLIARPARPRLVLHYPPPSMLRLLQLVDLRPSPGISTEVCRVYQAEQLDTQEQGGGRPDEEGELRSRWVPLPQAVSEVLTGRITNGLAIAGLLAAAAGTDDALTDTRPADTPWPGPAE